MKGTSIQVQLPRFFQEMLFGSLFFFKIFLRCLSCAVFIDKGCLTWWNTYIWTAHFGVDQLEVQAKFDHLPSNFQASQPAETHPFRSTAAYGNFLSIFLIFGTWNNGTELLKFSSFLGVLVVLGKKSPGKTSHASQLQNKAFEPWRLTCLKG